LAPEDVLLWDFFLESKYVLLEDQLHCTVAELRVLDGQPLLLEQRHVRLSAQSAARVGSRAATETTYWLLTVGRVQTRGSKESFHQQVSC
jgi:hypothetical protein